MVMFYLVTPMVTSLCGVRTNQVPSLLTEELQLTSDRLIKSMHYIRHRNYIIRQVSYRYNRDAVLVKVIDLAVIIVKPMV